MIWLWLAGALAAPAKAPHADEYWVILGSKRDAAEEIPGLAVLAKHPEVGAQIERLPSSRYKNLMPCYTVTIAGASADKARALALSKALRAIGVDHYVKNAGPAVAANPALDAWCAAGPKPTTGLVLRGEEGSLFLPIELPEPTAAELLAQAAPPKAVNGDLSTWYGELPVQNLGAYKLDDPVTLRDLTTGAPLTCTISSFGAATLGVPHFGQREAGLRAPACGSPVVTARLRCPGTTTGIYAVGSPKQQVWARQGAGPAAMTKALDGHPKWKGPREADEERNTAVTRYQHGGAALFLVEGTRSTPDSVCGGLEQRIAGLFKADGTAVFPLTALEASEVRGVADLDGDGVPELVLDVFPAASVVRTASGAEAARAEIGYCDCPC